MELNSWTIEGFANIQAPITYTPKQGAVLWNAGNGTGKTSMISALVWCIYGKTLKGVPTSDIPTYQADRLPGFRGTRVTVSITLPSGKLLEIARHIKYKGETWGVTGNDALLIREDGKLNTDFADKVEQNRYIISLLGINYNTLLNSYVFGQRMPRLAEASPADQRAQFETLFDLGWVEGLKKMVAPAEAEAVAAYNLTKGRIEYNQEHLGTLKASLEAEEESYQTALELYNEQAADIEAKVSKAQQELEELEEIASPKRVAFNQAQVDYKLASTRSKEHESKLISCTSQLKEAERKLASAEYSLEEYNNSVAALKESRDAAKKALDNYKYDPEYGKVELQELNKTVVSLQEAINTDPKCSLDHILSLKTAYKAAQEEVVALEHKIKACERQLQDAKAPTEDDVHDTCDMCGQAIEHESLAERLERHNLYLAGLRDEVTSLEANLVKSKQVAEKAKKAWEEAELNLDQRNEEVSNARRLYVKRRAEVEKYDNDYQELYEDYKEKDKAYNVDGQVYVTARDEAAANVQRASKELVEVKALMGKIATSLMSAQDAYQIAEQELHRADLKCSEASQYLSDLFTEKKALVAPVDATIVTLRKQIAKSEQDLEEAMQRLQTQEQDVKAYALLQKATRASGIKARMIGSLLDGFNKAVNMYGHKLGVNISFSIDDSRDDMPFKTQVDILHEGEWRTRAYSALSGGQQQRVSIAVTLGLAELLDSINPSDFIFLDEVFEGLDAAALEAAYDLLRVGRIANKKVIVISHQQAHGLQLRTETFTLNKGTLTIE